MTCSPKSWAATKAGTSVDTKTAQYYQEHATELVEC